MKYRSQWPTKIWGHSQCETEQEPRQDAYLLDRARDIKQNHWTMKYRSHWPTNSMKSLIVSDWTSIQSVMQSCLIGCEIQCKKTGTWNIGHNDLQKYEVTPSVKLNWCLYIRASDTRQNHWTMKDRSLRPTKLWVRWQCQTEQVSKVCLPIW